MTNSPAPVEPGADKATEELPSTLTPAMVNQATFRAACARRGLEPNQELFSLWQDCRTAVAPAQPTPAEPVYQVQIDADGTEWRDVPENGWKAYGAIYRRALYAAPAAVVASDDAARLDFLDRNAKFRMGWEVGAAPMGNLSVQSIIMGGKPIREAIDAAIRSMRKTEGAGE